MKASELIDALEDCIKAHGDGEVLWLDCYGTDIPIGAVVFSRDLNAITIQEE